MFILATCFEIDVWKGIWEGKRETISVVCNPSLLLFSLGSIPYSEIATDDLLQSLKSGNRLTKPAKCSDAVWVAYFFFFYAIITSIHYQTIVRLAEIIAIDFWTPEPGNYSYLDKLAFSASTVGDKGH